MCKAPFPRFHARLSGSQYVTLDWGSSAGLPEVPEPGVPSRPPTPRTAT